LPCVAALLVAMVCSELARFWMTHSSIPEAPSWGQFLAHVALVQSLLDVDSLSAGVWYVAIDVQLYALLLALMALARGSAVRLMAVMVLAVMASLFHFNRSAEWDAWALYFFGAYGLGALAYWFSARDADPAWGSRAWWLVVVGLVLVALWVDFRTRVGLALGTAWLLAWSQRSGWLFTWPLSRSVDYLSRISYSVFLLNFPVALVVNAWFTRFAAADPYTQTVGVLVAWLVVNAVAAGFHHLVELRLLRLQLPKPRRYWMASAK
jgi:peptidoglycan/LPS O-acetylase OafA/YrhL